MISFSLFFTQVCHQQYQERTKGPYIKVAASVEPAGIVNTFSDWVWIYEKEKKCQWNGTIR